MANAQRYLVGTVAALVVPASDRIQQVILHNHEHANNHDIFINGPGVTTTTGLHLPHTETIQFNVAAGDTVWAIADGASRDLRVLITRL